jgi:hypothetical protein
MSIVAKYFIVIYFIVMRVNVFCFIAVWFRWFAFQDLRFREKTEPVVCFSRFLAGDQILVLGTKVRATLAYSSFFDICSNRGTGTN